jgi:Zn-dependent metalloprotease
MLWNGSVMTYGDGSGTGGFDVLTALDVAGHEIGHAVCSNTANLTYQNESGAMNEGFQISGELVLSFQLHQQNQHGLVKISKEELVIYRFVQ